MFYCWLYVFVNSFSALLRQIGGNHFSPALILLMGSVFSVLYFHVINMKKIIFIYQQCWIKKGDWLSLNFSIAVIWICAIYGPSYLGASLYTFIFFSTLGVLGIISLYRRNTHQSLSELISLLGVLILFGYVFYKNLFPFRFNEIFGIFITVLGGSTAFLYSKQTAKFMKETTLNVTQVLSIRFYLSILLSFIFSLHSFGTVNIYHMYFALFIGIFCLIVPIYCFQKGIEKTGPEINAIICSFTPLFAAVLEEIYFRNLHASQFLIYIFYAILAALPYSSQQIKKLMGMPQ